MGGLMGLIHFAAQPPAFALFVLFAAGLRCFQWNRATATRGRIGLGERTRPRVRRLTPRQPRPRAPSRVVERDREATPHARQHAASVFAWVEPASSR